MALKRRVDLPNKLATMSQRERLAIVLGLAASSVCYINLSIANALQNTRRHFSHRLTQE